ncbi:MAG: hypothetical protein ACXAB4_02955 [Candidatus Hodarchaeales archaeon]|jgi:hypothetical protein
MVASIAYQTIPDQRGIGLCVNWPNNEIECGHGTLFSVLEVVPKGIPAQAVAVANVFDRIASIEGTSVQRYLLRTEVADSRAKEPMPVHAVGFLVKIYEGFQIPFPNERKFLETITKRYVLNFQRKVSQIVTALESVSCEVEALTGPHLRKAFEFGSPLESNFKVLPEFGRFAGESRKIVGNFFGLKRVDVKITGDFPAVSLKYSYPLGRLDRDPSIVAGLPDPVVGPMLVAGGEKKERIELLELLLHQLFNGERYRRAFVIDLFGDFHALADIFGEWHTELRLGWNFRLNVMDIPSSTGQQELTAGERAEILAFLLSISDPSRDAEQYLYHIRTLIEETMKKDEHATLLKVLEDLAAEETSITSMDTRERDRIKFWLQAFAVHQEINYPGGHELFNPAVVEKKQIFHFSFSTKDLKTRFLAMFHILYCLSIWAQEDSIVIVPNLDRIVYRHFREEGHKRLQGIIDTIFRELEDRTLLIYGAENLSSLDSRIYESARTYIYGRLRNANDQQVLAEHHALTSLGNRLDQVDYSLDTLKQSLSFLHGKFLLFRDDKPSTAICFCPTPLQELIPQFKPQLEGYRRQPAPLEPLRIVQGPRDLPPAKYEALMKIIYLLHNSADQFVETNRLMSFLEEVSSSRDLRREFEDCIQNQEGFLLDYIAHEGRTGIFGWVLSKDGKNCYKDANQLLQELPEAPDPKTFKELQYETQNLRSGVDDQTIDSYILPQQLQTVDSYIGGLLRLTIELRGEIPWDRVQEYQVLLKHSETIQALRERLNLFDRLWEDLYLQIQDRLPQGDVDLSDSEYIGEEMPKLLPGWWMKLQKLGKALSMENFYPDVSLFEIWVHAELTESEKPKNDLRTIFDQLTQESEESQITQDEGESDY